MWTVVVANPYDCDIVNGAVVRQVVVGSFHSEIIADRWRDQINEGYPDLQATTEWTYKPEPRDLREVLVDALKELREPQEVGT